MKALITRERILSIQAKLAEKLNWAGKPETFSLRYLKRRGEFVNYKESCGFNPETGEGHSYGWYSLSRVFSGQLVLNSYTYSNQTAKHINKMRSLFRDLGLKFVEIEAPRGLQDLNAAADYALSQQAAYLVKQKYARVANKPHYGRRAREYGQQLTLIRKLGGKPSTDLLSAIAKAGEQRESRLVRKAA